MKNRKEVVFDWKRNLLVSVLFIPLFFIITHYSDKSRQLKYATFQLKEIHYACEKYASIRDNQYPHDVGELVEIGYIKLDKNATDYWNYHVNSKSEIVAYSRRTFEGGAGCRLVYDVNKDDYIFYKADE